MICSLLVPTLGNMPAKKDIVGQRFGRLFVKQEAEGQRVSSRRILRRFIVECDCGTQFVVLGDSLRSGKTQSCGCLKKLNGRLRKISRLANKSFLVGERFGRWTVINHDDNAYGKHPKLICRCDCGTISTVAISNLRSGKSISCGCFREELLRSMRHLEAHGPLRTAEYRAWANMKTRCENRNGQDFHHYGGRGITVCNQWRNSYETFLNDMGRRPSNLHTLERVNNNEGYNPSNCIWATRKVQANNRRKREALTKRDHTSGRFSR